MNGGTRLGTSRTALLTFGVAALVLAALVTVIGQAQAAASKKVYDATVHVTGGAVTATSATLTLTLKNDATSNQTLGSANFTAPAGITLGTLGTPDSAGWTVTKVGSDVQFRSTTALAKGQSVSADVTVGIDQAACTAGTWTTRAKQSNDFSGNPGNDFALNLSESNLLPLGKFTIDEIGTQVVSQFVHQIYVNETKPVTVHAFDLCGEADAGYGTTSPGNFGDAATLSAAADTPARLVGSGLPKAIGSWPNGAASMKPVAVETFDEVVATDGVSGINATSNDFDVVEKICTFETICQWDNSNKKIHADAPSPPSGASLGIAFTTDGTLLQGFDCEGASALGTTLVYMNPRGYPDTTTSQTVTLKYDKSIPNTSGPVADFDLCLSPDNGVTWKGPIGDCSTTAPPCVQDRGRVQGNLVIVLHLDPHGDPVGGMK
jgi:hypothetical protein